jgi:hypothetical protein
MQVSPFPTADPPSACTTSSSKQIKLDSRKEKLTQPWETIIQNQKIKKFR